ncbi:tetratricopeptide repeat protein [Brachyspira intermedia]|uniref:tetratricopeptide repeat protein n=1 Tax=Brachyspira intermedia TaxID=84377 RepID=UPI00261721F9|nr:tetratricopeptide repeat protein [uncultured Brachyspira sp.]
MNLTQQEQNYYELIIDMLDDGVIDDSERNLLDKKKGRYGLSDSRAKEIEDFALQEIQNKNKPKFNTEGEKEYYELLEDIFEDGAIDESGRSLLNKRKSKYGISDEIAKEFEDYIKSIRGVNDTTSNSSNKENSDDLFEQGRSYYDDKQYEEAIKCFKKAVELEPNNDESWRWLGNTYLVNSNNDEALEAFLKAIEIDSNKSNNWNSLGLLYKEKKEYEKALETLNKAIQLDKQDYSPLVNISNVYRFMENYDKAIEYALKASELHTSAYKALSLAYIGGKKFKEAKETINKYLQFYPFDDKMKEILESMEQNEKLKKVLESLNDDEIFELIEKLENADEGKELKLACNEALDKMKQLFQNDDYNYTEAFFNLSEKLVLKLYDMNRYSDIIYINKNISILEAKGYSDFINSMFYLYVSSKSYYFIDNYYKAVDGFINLIENYDLDDEQLYDVMFPLAYSYLELGNYQGAIESYEKTLDLDDSNPYAWQNYGVALENAGRIEDAKYAYNRSLEMDPDNDYVKERLRNISSPSDIVSGIVKGIGKFFK